LAVEYRRIADIKVGNRFRKDLDTPKMAAEIELVGYMIQPIGVTVDNWLAYGQRRLEGAKLLGWDKIPVNVVPTKDPDDMVLIEWYENAARKDFTVSERVAILEDIEKRRIGHRVSKEKVAKLAIFQQEFKGKPSPDITAEITHTSPAQLKKEKKLVQTVRQNPEKYGSILEKVDANKMKVNEAWSRIEKEQKKQKLLADASANNKKLPDGIKLIHGDFIEILADPKYDNSIDLTFSDPPYAEQYLYLYNDIGRFAARVLKEGSSLVVYCPQLYFLQRVSRVLEGAEGLLDYHWMVCIRHNGAKERIYPKQVFVEWKPLVWFVKGKLREGYDFVPDFVARSRPDKDLDRWAQSTVDADHVIRRLTVENQIVLDPMMGRVATTGKAAVDLKRKFIGIEKDPENFKLADATMKSHLQKRE
jgi:DNA methylase/ParB-like nuclease domain